MERSKVKGEGDHEAGRKYQKKQTEFAKSGKVEPAAREAKRAVEDDEEGEELEEAEREGKRKADYEDV